jgi:hypothetical protein
MAEQKAKVVEWEDLKGTFEFEDPFTKLNQSQIYNLALVARIRSFEERGRNVSEQMREEADEAQAKLEKEKIDIDGLLAKREEITQLRKKRASMPVEELNGKLIELSGFVLPLEYEEKKVKEFLLVPWVGACIHTPPPPPNQITHVVAEEAFSTKGTFEAVTVRGVIQLEKRESELFLVDGKAMIPMSYVFKNAGVEKFKDAE